MSDSRRRKTELSKYEWNMLQEYIKRSREPEYKYNYSIRVGTGADTENIKEVWMRKLIRHNTQLRIDCVKIELSGEPEIIEVKKVAQPGAIGQLLAYKKLYDEDYGTKAEMTLLCRYASNTMLKLCDHFGIKVETLGTYN
jgi:hypothetical protein